MGRRGSVEALVSARRALHLYAHGQVDKGEDVVLDHDREAEEDGIQDQDVNAQLEVQSPFVEVDAQNLRVHKLDFQMSRARVKVSSVYSLQFSIMLKHLCIYFIGGVFLLLFYSNLQ